MNNKNKKVREDKNMEELKQKIKDSRNGTTNARNSMGCSENWYNSYYAIANTFTDEEIDAMGEKELNNLIKLGDNISEGLY